MILSMKDLTGREHRVEAVWVKNHVSTTHGESALVPTRPPDEVPCDVITRLTWDTFSMKVLEATPEEKARLESHLDLYLDKSSPRADAQAGEVGA